MSNELNDINKSGELQGIVLSGSEGVKPIQLLNGVFEDKAYPLIGKRLTSNAGTADYDYDELAVAFSAGGSMSNANDLVAVTAEIPHQAMKDQKIYPHIHVWQVSSNNVVFELDYRWQGNGQLKTEPWTRMTAESSVDSLFTYVSGTLNQIIEFKDASNNHWIDTTGYGLSATMQFKLTRTDNTTGVVSATFFDFHYEVDDMGSREPLSK